MNRRLAWLAAFLLSACAYSQRNSAPHPPVDAVLSSDGRLLLFDFTQNRYQIWKKGEGCGPSGTPPAAWTADRNWLALAAPGMPFSPVRAASGPGGHFYLLDRIGGRLCLYDSSAQFLSCLPLPRELQDRNPERLQVFRGRDGIFTFLDLSEGAAWQFSEMRTTGGQADWRLIHRIRLPVNLESCLWEPFFRNPCCRVKTRSGPVSAVQGAGGSGTVCFDRYFNSEGPFPAAADPVARDFLPTGSEGWEVRAGPAPGGPGWLLTLGSGGECPGGGSPPRYCYYSDRKLLAPCPASAEAPGPAVP